MMYRGTYSPEFYRVLYRVTHHEFRLQHARHTLAQIQFHLRQWRVKRLRLLASISYHGIRLALARRRLNALERGDTRTDDSQSLTLKPDQSWAMARDE